MGRTNIFAEYAGRFAMAAGAALLAMAVCHLGAQSVPSRPATTSTPASAPAITQAQIAKAVDDLSSDQYTVREEAAKLLCRAGGKARAAVERAAKSHTIDVAIRAADILKKIKLGDDPDMPPALRECLRKYRVAIDRAAEMEDQEHLGDLLLELGKRILDFGPPGYRVMAGMIRQDPEDAPISEDLRQELRSRLVRPALEAIDRGDIDMAAALLEDNLQYDFDPTIRDYAALASQAHRLDTKIARLETTDDPAELRILTFLYRAKGDLTKAAAAAKKAGDEKLLVNIQEEQCDWKALAAWQDRLGAAGSEEYNQPLQAIFHYFADRRDRADKGLRSDKPVAAIKGANDPVFLLIMDCPQEAMKACADTKSYDVLYGVLIEQCKYEDAFRLVEQALKEKHPSAVDLQIKMAATLKELGRNDQAKELLAKLFEDAVKQHRDNPHAVEILGDEDIQTATEHALRMMKTQDLLNQSRIVARLSAHYGPDLGLWWILLDHCMPKDDQAHRLSTLLKLLDGKLPKAEVEQLADKALAGEADWMEALTENDPSAPYGRFWQPTTAKEGIWSITRVCAKAGLSRQVDKCIALLARRAGQPDEMVEIGYFLAEQKQWKKAADFFAKAAERDAHNLAALMLRGYALTQFGERAQGSKLMAQADLKCLGDHGNRWGLIAAMESFHLDEPIAHQQEMVRKAGDLGCWEYDALGEARALRKKGYYAKACLFYERAMVDFLRRSRVRWTVLDLEVAVHVCLAQEHLAANRIDQAMAEADFCFQVNPADVKVAMVVVPQLDGMGKTQEADKLYGRVHGYYEALLKQYPSAPGIHNNLAWIGALSRRDLPASLDHAQAAVRLSPRLTGHLDTLAEVRFQMGDPKQAIQTMRKCIDMEIQDKGSQVGYFRRQLRRFESGDVKSQPQ